MKRLVNLILLLIVVFSCRPVTGDQKAQNELGSTGNRPGLQEVASQFPAAKLDELVDGISQEELEKVISEGESGEWTRTVFDVNRGEAVIKNKHAGDNSVRFVLYGHGSQWAMLGVQQQNAQVSTTKVWEYHYVVNGDHPERWNQHLLPEYKLDSFFDEKIKLPEQFTGQVAQPYLNFELTPTSINISVNKWSFMRTLESNSLQPEGPLDPALVKYVYMLTWNGDGFEEEKVKEAGYSDVLTFTSRSVDDPDHGPGPHEIGCSNGVMLKASSFLSKEGAYTYNVSNVVDKDETTAWAEGVKGDGAGEWIEFTIAKDYAIGPSWQIANGYTRNKEVWQANGRVKKMNVLVDGQVVGYVMLSNVSTYQTFNISPNWLRDPPAFRKGTIIRFVIEEVYKGSRYDDTLISSFVPMGNCR